MTNAIAVDAKGNRLLAFERGAEEGLTRRDSSIPLPLALVVADSDRGTLLVFNRWRQEWELPGGMIDEGETPHEAAAREYAEETGQPPPTLDFAGIATFELMPDRRLEYAALYRAQIPSALMPFAGNDEIEQLCWWDGAALPRLSELDAQICRKVTASATG